MERRIGKLSATIVVAAFFALTLAVCSNPIDLVKEVSTEVKIATNKFLLIKGVGPSANGSNVNPGLPLTITFDRDISLADIEKNITITPSVSFKLPPSYNQATKTLSIEADPYFGMETSYTVTINEGVKGADGSDLQSGYSWSFRTGTYPTGSVTITDAGYNTLDWTNDDATPALRIQSNPAADRFRLSNTEAGLASAPWLTPTSTDYKVPDASALGFSLGSTEGPQSVYVQFIRNYDSAYSVVRSDTVILDKTKPTVDAGTQQWVNSTLAKTPVSSASDPDPDGTGPVVPSGIKSYVWSCTNPNVVITPNNVLRPSLSMPGGTDGDYTVTLTVFDNAGNFFANSMTLTRDTVPPGSPGITATTPSLSNTPTWTLTSNGGNGVYAVVLESDETGVVFEKENRGNFPDPKVLEYLTGNRIYPLRDFVWTLSAREYDNAGNISATASSFAILVTPVLPLDGTTGLNGLAGITLQWRTLRDGYRIFLWPHGEKPVSIGETDRVPSFLTKELKSQTQYDWCIQGDTWLPPKAPDMYYTFTTAKY